jgi:hypothetical protein
VATSRAAAIGRIGAYTLHSTHDSRELTVPARSAFLRGFEARVDPKGELPKAERQRRARAALKAHMGRLALKSAEARRKRTRG